LVQLFDLTPFLGFLSVEGEKEIKNLIILFFKKDQERSRRMETPLGVKFSLLILLIFYKFGRVPLFIKRAIRSAGALLVFLFSKIFFKNSSLKVHRRYETLQKNKIVL